MLEENLIETPRCRQIPGDARRRWFSSSTLDLIVWYSSDDRSIGFQLCYQDGTEGRAVTWSQDSGYSHNRIDEGEGKAGRAKMAPIRVSDGLFDKDRVLRLFELQSWTLDPTIAQTVRHHLRAYPE